MKDVYIYDMDSSGVITLKGVTDRLRSLRWTRRFFRGDSFEAVFPASGKELELISRGRMIEIPERHSGFITSVKLENAEGAPLIRVSGCSFAGMLARRVLYDGDRYDSFMTILDKNAGEAAYPYKRRFPGAVFDKTRDCPGYSAAGASDEEMRFKSLEAFMERVGKAFGFGVRGSIVQTGIPYIRFSGSFRADRTVGQSGNIPVVFSEKHDSIRSLGSVCDGSGAMTNAVVYSPASYAQGYEIPEWQLCLGDYYGWQSVEKSYETSPRVQYSGNVPGLNYPAMLSAGEAIQSMMYKGFTEKLNVSLVIDDNYRERFDAGDLVTVQSSFLNKTQNMTITEITELFENGGCAVSAVMEAI